ncbi:unnamed protein product, partial [Iphiclides podalirius]
MSAACLLAASRSRGPPLAPLQPLAGSPVCAAPHNSSQHWPLLPLDICVRRLDGRRAPVHLSLAPKQATVVTSILCFLTSTFVLGRTWTVERGAGPHTSTSSTPNGEHCDQGPRNGAQNGLTAHDRDARAGTSLAGVAAARSSRWRAAAGTAGAEWARAAAGMARGRRDGGAARGRRRQLRAALAPRLSSLALVNVPCFDSSRVRGFDMQLSGCERLSAERGPAMPNQNTAARRDLAAGVQRPRALAVPLARDGAASAAATPPARRPPRTPAAALFPRNALPSAAVVPTRPRTVRSLSPLGPKFAPNEACYFVHCSTARLI